jgi:hypothetical protein
MAETRTTAPKPGDHVGTTQHEGVFEVVFVKCTEPPALICSLRPSSSNTSERMPRRNST